MNYNISTGGLICEAGDKLLLTDIRSYSGTYLRSGGAGDQRLLDGVFWFMNRRENTIYYSDQSQGHRLYRWDLAAASSQLLLDRPCCGLVLNGDWLYYKSETDHKLYRCLLDGRKESRITDEPVECFVVDEEQVYYATQHGIRSCSVTGSSREQLSDSAAVQLLKIGDNLLFADAKNQYLLTALYLQTGEARVYADVSPNSLNSDGRYIYCANRSNDSSVYRIDPSTGSKIRICGDSADHIHILGDTIYFSSRFEWHKMSLTGGQAEKVINMS
ncbi:DUF5050 domain-containing protein [Paenibacillus ihumii]|uniref:DUF5050 domain-containing protein n=1 Tax=Paenibacillus ihumii TaxID=687436 RepID=UPI0006D7A399|nr:DUF5050 domain-containing protein [Paenibacillus ihumii]